MKIRTFFCAWVAFENKDQVACSQISASGVCHKEVCSINENPHWRQLIEINSAHLWMCPFPQNKWGINNFSDKVSCRCKC